MQVEGVSFCHRSWVLHRDLKPNNLLIGEGGVLKLGDFGLARTYGSPERKLTHQVITAGNYHQSHQVITASNYHTVSLIR